MYAARKVFQLLRGYPLHHWFADCWYLCTPLCDLADDTSEGEDSSHGSGTVGRIVEGDVMAVARHERHRSHFPEALLAVHALPGVDVFLRVELAYDVGALHVVVVVVHQHLVALARLVVESAAFGGHGRSYADPGGSYAQQLLVLVGLGLLLGRLLILHVLLCGLLLSLRCLHEFSGLVECGLLLAEDIVSLRLILHFCQLIEVCLLAGYGLLFLSNLRIVLVDDFSPFDGQHLTVFFEFPQPGLAVGRIFRQSVDLSLFVVDGVSGIVDGILMTVDAFFEISDVGFEFAPSDLPLGGCLSGPVLHLFKLLHQQFVLFSEPSHALPDALQTLLRLLQGGRSPCDALLDLAAQRLPGVGDAHTALELRVVAGHDEGRLRP